MKVPPWDKPDLRSLLGSMTEGKTSKAEARITNSEARALAKLIQHRSLPELETASDAVRAGLRLLFAYAEKRGTSKEVSKVLDLLEWETSVASRKALRTRLTALMDELEESMTEAEKEGRHSDFVAFYEELERNKDLISDEKLKGRANTLWILNRPHYKKAKGA